MHSRLFFWVARISSIIISYVALGFITEASYPVGFVRTALAVMIGTLGTLFVLYHVYRNRQTRQLSWLPFGFWLGLSAFYLLGGFPQLSIIQYFYLTVLAGSFTLLSWYAWQNYTLGGVIYFAIGLFYAFISLGKIKFIALIIVIGFLWQTGILFMMVDPKKVFKKPAPAQPLPPQQPTSPPQELANTPPAAS